MRWPTNLRKRLFPLEITKRIYLGMVVLMLVPTLVLSAVTYYQFFAIERLSRTDTLYEAATQLDLAIKSSFGSFDNILSTHQTEQLSYQQKIDLLNDAIQPVLLKVAARYPGFGLGIYSAKMDSVLAFSPKFNRTQLVSLPHNSPLFSAYNTAKPALILSNGLPNAEGNSSLSLSYPIYSAGTVVGVAWATVKMGDVYLGALTRASTSLLIGFGLIGILGFSSWWMFSKFHRELENFAQAVVEERPELPEGILPELNPLLQLVKGRTYALQELNSQLQSEVNQRHKAQEELLHLAYLVESTGDAIIGIVNGTIVSWNSGAEKMYGYSAQEIRGQHISSLFVRQNTPYMDDINDRLAKGEQLVNYEVISVTKNGRQFDVSLTISQIKDASGRVVGISTIARDISLQKELEKDMTRLDRLGLVGEMAAGIGHEIRNPMTTVRGFLQMLGTKHDCTQYHEYFTLMISELDRANSIITEFLTLAKDKTVELKMHDLNAILQNIAPLIKADAMVSNKVVKLELAELPLLPLNEKEICQIILNLTRNGLEAMEEKGELWIRTFLQDSMVVLAVQDQGTGIPANLLNKLGTPFFTTKETGTGLGLAVCYSIASRHHAQIKLTTGANGTTVFIYFATPPPQQNTLSA